MAPQEQAQEARSCARSGERIGPGGRCASAPQSQYGACRTQAEQDADDAQDHIQAVRWRIRSQALQAVPCQASCQDLACSCDEATRMARLAEYSQGLEQALQQAIRLLSREARRALLRHVAEGGR